MKILVLIFSLAFTASCAKMKMKSLLDKVSESKTAEEIKSARDESRFLKLEEADVNLAKSGLQKCLNVPADSKNEYTFSAVSKLTSGKNTVLLLKSSHSKAQNMEEVLVSLNENLQPSDCITIGRLVETAGAGNKTYASIKEIAEKDGKLSLTVIDGAASTAENSDKGSEIAYELGEDAKFAQKSKTEFSNKLVNEDFGFGEFWTGFREHFLKETPADLIKEKLVKFPVSVKGPMDDNPELKIKDKNFKDLIAALKASPTGTNKENPKETEADFVKAKEKLHPKNDVVTEENFRLSNMVFSKSDEKWHLVQVYLDEENYGKMKAFGGAPAPKKPNKK
ncbi:MAG TPA: hypothetical protein PL048_11495 [Leptospiraceae bacterium]|nr:hypothetical protein [Leptospiraceae bacterium]HMZ59393.1 hypothetical protein [Leptospiraceae bacterium]HNF14753.1 hypothetical protein [Leptospiraceae bacterium]HNF23689.1 hypothetical protein [Leptospiraceae bacterium]HNI95048.1 hypothetical protein [Leptospiraceae bacterium]